MLSVVGVQGDFLNKGGKQQKPKKRSGDSKRSSGNSGGTRGNKGLSSVGSVRASAAFPPGSGRYAAMQPLVGVVISKSGHLQCPPPIVALRAALAQTSLCKGLRPQALPVKLAACGILSALANMPPGMVKEHFKKFSPLWILTVHISIPFVAALRKAVVLPPHAIACTIGGAIAGTHWQLLQHVMIAATTLCALYRTRKCLAATALMRLHGHVRLPPKPVQLPECPDVFCVGVQVRS